MSTKAIETTLGESYDLNTIIDAKKLKGALVAVTQLVGECKIRFTDEGLEMRAVDKANVGMVDLCLETDEFDFFHVDDRRDVLGVDVNRLASIVAFIEKGDETVHISLESDESKLKVEGGDLEYSMALIDPSVIRSIPDLPDFELPASVTFAGAEFHRAVVASDLISNYLIFGADVDTGEFYIETKGDTDAVSYRLGEEDVVDMTIAPARSLFSLNYLKEMRRAIPKNGEVKLELGDEYPVRIRFTLPKTDSHAEYILAPRIDSNQSQSGSTTSQNSATDFDDESDADDTDDSGGDGEGLDGDEEDETEGEPSTSVHSTGDES